MKIINSLWSKKNFSADGIIDLHPEANMIFNSLTIGFQENKMLFSNVNGKLSMLNYYKGRKFPVKIQGTEHQG